ncbi:type II toxin-antitoxin system RelE/ParE family toxin [Escherichia coli]
MGSCAAPSAKGDDKFITTDYLQQCHRKHIREYIAEQNLMAAIELDERIGYSASSLAGQPYKGRNGRVEGTRELVIHPHFVLVYEVDSQWGKVYILRVLHTAQKWP